MKSYVKLASGFMLSGVSAVFLERAVASGMANANMHLPVGSGWLTTAMAVIPLALLAIVVVIYIGGAILGLK
jgi:hypothetical protein